MGLSSIVVLLLVLSSLALETDLSRALSRAVFSTNVRRLAVPAICLALVATLAARIAIDEGAASIAPGIPIGIDLDQHVSGSASDFAMLVACLQTAFLVALAAVVGTRRLAVWETIVFGLTAAAMMVLSVHAPVLRSTDLYSYVGYAHLGASAYEPVARPFPGSFHAIDRIVGNPLVPSPYGPVWLAISRVIVSTGSNLASQLSAFRFFSVGVFVAVLAILRLRNVPVLVLVLFALDPEIYEQYVIDGHNDL